MKRPLGLFHSCPCSTRKRISLSMRGHGVMKTSLRPSHVLFAAKYVRHFPLIRSIFFLTLHTYQQIHVDRYKHNVYSHLSGDPFLRSIITRDAASTRFHACERFDRCEYVDAPREHASAAKVIPSINSSAGHVVYVNPVTMGVAGWELYQKETKAKLARGEVVNILVCFVFIFSGDTHSDS